MKKGQVVFPVRYHQSMSPDTHHKNSQTQISHSFHPKVTHTHTTTPFSQINLLKEIQYNFIFEDFQDFPSWIFSAVATSISKGLGFFCLVLCAFGVGFLNMQKGKNRVRFCTKVPVPAFEQLLGMLEFNHPNIFYYLMLVLHGESVPAVGLCFLPKGFSSLELETNVRIPVMIKVFWADSWCYKNVRKKKIVLFCMLPWVNLSFFACSHGQMQIMRVQSMQP